ncbi:MAG: dihydroorotate dehydrogenase-like protein [Kiritimatiellaeota bacterium]|nr:dihydroorotate dehydrogenase-like protein [Kiritimatiellota bacterium]
MAVDLTTQYLGLGLRNPLIVGASSLTLTADAIRRCEAAGAGAVVVKSLFEEQIRLDSADLQDAVADQSAWHAEVFEYMEADLGMRYGARDYLDIIRQARDSVDIPVIASINCVSDEWWCEFAQEVEAAGADALELNIALAPASLDVTGAELECQYERIVIKAREQVSLPLAVKLGPWFTSLPQTVLRLQRAGADGFVLFNRFYCPTIDPEKLEVVAASAFSSPAELSLPLRWISLFADRVAADFAGATGVHSGLDAVRLLLAGAHAVQVVSALYLNGLEHLQKMLDEITAWMEQKKHGAVKDFRGMLSQARNPDRELFGRLQYIKGLVGIE